MDTVVSRSVLDLPAQQRTTLEQLIGRPLAAEQQVLIMIVDPPAIPSEAARERAAVGIRKIIAEAQAHADAHHVTDDEADAAVEEAMAHVRRRA
jgi:hypothetical protein